MNDKLALEIVNKIFLSVFDEGNKDSLEELRRKLAFDVKLPMQVRDTTTGEITFAITNRGTKFITSANMYKKDKEEGWILPRKKVSSLQEIFDIWESVNFITTERVSDSFNVLESDTIYRCRNVYRSMGCSDSANIIYCDSCSNSEFLLASKRSFNCNYAIRCDDANDCSNCYNVIYSFKVSNSMFIQDCANLDECMFCSHINSKRFCIANMQFEENEYMELKKLIIKWLISSIRNL